MMSGKTEGGGKARPDLTKMEKEKENSLTLRKKGEREKEKEGRCSSRGRGLMTRNANPIPITNNTTRSGVRNTGRATVSSENHRNVAKEKEGATLRWSTSSLPNNSESGKKSSQSSSASTRISRIINGLQRQRLLPQKGNSVSPSPIQIRELEESRSRSSHMNENEVSSRRSKEKEKAREKEEEEEEGNRFSSKLHQRLAFLEGRVKQIGCELQRTKEMLDANKNENSITMLSQIQIQIMGIEKAMTQDGFLGAPHKTSSPSPSPSPSCNWVVGRGGFCVKKRLNDEELEERLFPHQKLLRSRGASSSSSSCAFLHAEEGEVEKNAELSPIEEDPIAAEFLHALKNNTTNSETRPISNDNENDHLVLECDENLEFNDEENKQSSGCFIEEIEEDSFDRLNQLGQKTSTAGWFVSEGESILLAHDDGTCSYHDIANSEEKAEYKAPHGIAPNIWGDCWLIRAAGSDGRSGKYVVAASAGSTLDSGFCSWDFYNKEIVAFHTEAEGFICPSSTGTFSPVSTHRIRNMNMLRRSCGFANVVPEIQHWWYRPCGPLLVATASAQKQVSVYDIRDGDHVMKWETQRDVTNMNYSSPLQWRNKGKVVVAETEAISLWDVNSLDPRPLHCVVFPGRKVSALHVHNTDAECNGGIIQRISSSETEGNDGVFCTQDSVNVFDFRTPSGVGLKIPMFGENGQSLFARGDLIFAGVVNPRFSSSSKVQVPVRCRVHQWSIRKGKPVGVYTLPESNAHFEQLSVAQVWGSLNLVMAINGNGLFIFDACKEDGLPSASAAMREVIGSDDLFCPSFDYSGSRILLVSKDHPAFWRYWS